MYGIMFIHGIDFDGTESMIGLTNTLSRLLSPAAENGVWRERCHLRGDHVLCR